MTRPHCNFFLLNLTTLTQNTIHLWVQRTPKTKENPTVLCNITDRKVSNASSKWVSLGRVFSKQCHTFGFPTLCCPVDTPASFWAIERQGNESVITDSPHDSTLLRNNRRLGGLTFNAEIHDVAPADSTVIDYSIPGPEATAFLFLTPKRSLPAPLLVPLAASTSIAAAILEIHSLCNIISVCIYGYSPPLFQIHRAKTGTPSWLIKCLFFLGALWEHFAC